MIKGFIFREAYLQMAIHSIKSIQKIPAPIDQVWEFFSSHTNLQTITPPGMGFNIISQNVHNKLHEGQIIEYKVRPLFNIPLYWMTEIRNVNAPFYFMDEQRKGPYSIWQHQHIFRTIDGGTEMTDLVLYKNPFGIIGELGNVLFVRKKLKAIFLFRFNRIDEIFGKWDGKQEAEINMS